MIFEEPVQAVSQPATARSNAPGTRRQTLSFGLLLRASKISLISAGRMSKSSVASTPKTPASQLPSKSAWSRGPPQTASPRSQSPAPSNQPPAQATHSRRPSNLGQGIPIKDGVSIPRNVGATKTNSAVSFGSIDDASAPLSSSPAAMPAVKASSEGVKSFGSVPATVSQINGKSSVLSSTKPPPLSHTSSSTSVSGASTTPSTSTSVSAKPKVDVKKFFQTSSTPSTSQSTSDTSSPSMRPLNLPQQPLQPSVSNGSMAAPPFTPFVPGGLRSPANPQASGVPTTPRSPNYPRQQIPNGNGPRPPNGPAPPGPQMQPPMGSPRLGPHPHPSQQPNVQMQPPMQMGWSPYYGYMPPPGMPPDQGYMYPPPWQYPGMPPQSMPPPHHPQQHPPLPHQPSQIGPHPSMPMSPRNPPPPLQSGPPGTPTPSHASVIPHSPHPAPLSHAPSGSIGGVSSPPPTPSSATHPPGSARLNSSASAFVPRPTSKIIIKSADGSEVVDIENLKKNKSHQSSPSITSTPISSPSPALNSPSKRAIPIVAPDAKMRREEKEREEKESQAKAVAAEKERKAREKAEEEKKKKAKEEEQRLKKEKEETARKEKEEVERKEREDRERKAKEEAERKEKAEAERQAKEEAERKAKEEEAERKRKEAEEEEKKRRAEEERIRQEKLKLEAEENQRKEAERKKKEEEARLRQEEEAAAEAKAKAEEEAKARAAQAEAEAREDGEIEDDEKASSDAQDDSKSEEKNSLRIDTAAPTEHATKRRPGRLDLSVVKNIPAPLPSALATARIIDDLGSVPYPEGVKSPKIELNVNAKDGKFRYDRDFLLQFMSVCKEKPDNLPALDAIGLDAPNQPFPMTRTQSGRGSRAGSSMRSASVGLGFAGGAGFKSGPGNSFGGMGNFGSAGSAASKLTSEERFQLANPTTRTVSMSGVAPFPRPQGIQRTASTGGPGSQIHTGRTRSKRGDKRTDTNKAASGGGNYQQSGYGTAYGPGGVPLEPVAPLQMTENRWDRKSIANINPDSPEVVDRKVKALLNKLTMEKFDSISDQIIDWANKSEKEKDGRTLIQVIRLVFEKATDEATWSEMYARLCRKMMEQISPKVQDDGIKNAEGKPIAGGHLFRKYLLNRCQEDFERGWVNKEATAAAAATKAMEDEAAKAANESKGEEIALYSDEYYAAQKAKRQGLGLIKFIGELFKLQMLTERIMHECVKKLLGNVENPEEEEIENLCKLLATVGQMLDTPKARAHMNVYFDRMKELTKSQNDIIELRERKWQQRNTVAAPTTIAKIHEAAAKEKAAADKESFNRQISMSRSGSRRGGERGEQPGADGWTVSGNAPRPPPKAGDLSKFGQISNKVAPPITFGPSSVFVNKKDIKRETLSRTNSNANMFQMLQNVEAAEVPSNSSRPPSRKASIDLGSGGAPEAAPQRKRLVLQPRTRPLESDSAPHQESDSDEDDNEAGEEPEQEMSEAEAKKKIAEDTKEFFGVRNLEEAEVYFAKLPAVHHRALVDKLVSDAIESKEADARLVGDFFQRAVSKELCSSSALEEGFLGIAEFLDDIAIDAPRATDLFAIMITGADLTVEQRTTIASKSVENGDKLLKLISTFTPLIFSGIFYACNGEYKIKYIDALFNCVSAIAVCGLTTVDLSSLTPWQQVILVIQMCLGSPILVSWVIVYTRKYYFEQKFENIIAAAAARKRVSVPEDRSSFLVRWIRSLLSLVKGHKGDGLPMTRQNSTESSGTKENSRKTPKKFRTDMIRRMDDAPKLVNPSGWISEGDRIPLGRTNTAHSQTQTRQPDPTSPTSQEVNSERKGIHMSRRLSDPGTPSRPVSPHARSIEFSTTLPRRRARINTLHEDNENNSHSRPGTEPLQADDRRSMRRSSMNQGTPLMPSHTYSTYKSGRRTKHSGFGGFPMPHEINYQNNDYTVSTTIASQRGENIPPGAKIVSYFSFDAVVGRNSAFPLLSDEQMDELGGVEYRALYALLWIVAGYHIGVQLIAFIVISSYISIPKWKDDFLPPALHRPSLDRFSFYQTVSAYTNTGSSLVDQSMVPFQKAYPMIVIMMILILAGNTAFPASDNIPLGQACSSDFAAARNITILTRPSTTMLYLSVPLASDLVLIDDDIGTPTIEAIPVGVRILAGLFQAIAVRAAGFAIVTISALAPGVKVLYVIMMYISVYPIAMSVRSTNVYEEQSLGIYHQDADFDEHEFPVGGSRMTVWSKYLAMHARKQLSFDMWWLALALGLRRNLDDTSKASWFNIFNILFELTSAYGTVGLSVGLPDQNYSFSGALRPLSKLIVCVVMLRGKHRGLPVAIDRAVMLPSEYRRHDERDAEEASQHRPRWSSHDFTDSQNHQASRVFHASDGVVDNDRLSALQESRLEGENTIQHII
ncbi:hypothetical protein D9757_000476 [Collybiopsis confluens]|uniref:MI domain-containing protein n=1 Tax=Collybiopsis confluens TaxID=2823264 RepID=A0A8H5I1U9_9AGAR|nr:hypothetical protein D9757_000476 [Collybiopsis confluens]